MHSDLYEHAVILRGSGKKRLADFKKSKASIVITNYEAMLMKDLHKALMVWGPEVLICDESHRVKNIAAKRTKAVIQIADKATYKYLLSGTPCPNSPMDLFAQFRIMDGGETFSKNFQQFRATYFYDQNAGMPAQAYFPNWQLKPGSIDIMNKLINKVSMTVKKTECLDLPPLVVKNILVPLSKEQTKAYEAMAKDFLTYIGDRAAVATIALTKLLRLQQIVSGFITVEGPNGREEHTFRENPRIDALKELLEDLSPTHKILVWATFRENFRQIAAVCEGLGISFGQLHGSVSNKERERVVENFNNPSGDIRVLISHPGSGGIGINLTISDVCIFYSRGYSLEHDTQATARNYRAGSEVHTKVTRIDLVAENTIDEVILKALKNKEDVANRILEVGKTYARSLEAGGAECSL
jgi:SNF2 family DNA or RNA helicase